LINAIPCYNHLYPNGFCTPAQIEMFMKFMFKPCFLLIALLVLSIQLTYSQDDSKFGIESGYGYYEGLYIGGKYKYQKRLFINVAFGTLSFVSNNESYYSITIKNDLGFNLKKDPNKPWFSWWFSGKIVYWRYEDPYYIWNVMSFIPTIEKNFRISNRLDFRVGMGPSIKLVLDFQRKTFEEVGWPYNVRPNFNLMLIYHI